MTRSLTQRFIAAYHTIEKQYDGKVDSEQIYKEALEMLHRERQMRVSEEDPVEVEKVKIEKMTESGKELDSNVNVKITDLFK